MDGRSLVPRWRLGDESYGPGISVSVTEAPISAWPFMVSLGVSAGIEHEDHLGGHYCGGTLVADQWVLTAAHCVYGKSSAQLDVVIGAQNLSQTHESLHYNVSAIWEHPDYHPAYLTDDIALIHLVEKSEAPLAQIPTELDHYVAGTHAYILGWGMSPSDVEHSSALQQAIVPIVSDEICYEQAYGEYFPPESFPKMQCAGYLREGGIDTCDGDSGGPLLVESNLNGYEVVGITSWGIGCALPNFPGVYTEVLHYNEWIFSHICEAVPGDLNGDQHNNIIDVYLLVDALFEAPALQTACDFYLGDMHQDGQLDVMDVLFLVDKILSEDDSPLDEEV